MKWLYTFKSGPPGHVGPVGVSGVIKIWANAGRHYIAARAMVCSFVADRPAQRQISLEAYCSQSGKRYRSQIFMIMTCGQSRSSLSSPKDRYLR